MSESGQARAPVPGGGRTPLLESVQPLLGASAVIAGALYSCFHLSLVVFYDNFGVTPEDVGWDLQSTLVVFIVPLVFGFSFLVVPLFYGRRTLLRGRSLFRWALPLYAATGVLSFLAYAILLPYILANARASIVQ